MIIFLFLIAFLILINYFVNSIQKNTAYLIIFFNGIWIVALISLLLFGNNNVLKYCTLYSFIVLGTHFLFVNVGYSLTKESKPLKINKFIISLKKIYYLTLSFSILGMIIISLKVNLLDYLLNQQIARLRSDSFEGYISINGIEKMFANFVYPFSIFSGLYYYRKKSLKIFLIFILIASFFSLLNGGKGSLIILTCLFLGSLFFNYNFKQFIDDSKLKYSILFLLIIILIYFIFIAFTRTSLNSEGLSFIDIIDELFGYFTHSIPAFSQWLQVKPISYFKFDISQISIIREISNLLGKSNPRTMDDLIVYIPDQFNVFTCFADSISAFGILGSHIYYFLIGSLLKIADNFRNRNISPIFYSLFFLFVINSLFSDSFFFMFGTWLCLSMQFFIKIKLN